MTARMMTPQRRRFGAGGEDAGYPGEVHAGEGGGGGAVVKPGPVDDSGGLAPPGSAVPQNWQKLASGRFGPPHCVQNLEAIRVDGRTFPT